MLPDLEMEMSAGTSSRTADVSYPLSLLYALSLLDTYPRKMTIPGFKSISMLYDDKFSVSAHIASMGDTTVFGGINAGSITGSEVQTAVKCTSFGKWVSPISES